MLPTLLPTMLVAWTTTKYGWPLVRRLSVHAVEVASVRHVEVPPGLVAVTT